MKTSMEDDPDDYELFQKICLWLIALIIYVAYILEMYYYV